MNTETYVNDSSALFNTAVIEEKSAEAIDTSSNSDNLRSGGYKCGRCGKPKKGHVCDYASDYERETSVTSTQAEIDPSMTILVMKQDPSWRSKGFETLFTPMRSTRARRSTMDSTDSTYTRDF